MNILLIYDLAMHRVMLERFLRMDDHVIVCASRVEDPLHLVKGNNRFDIVICDLLKPETDGITIYKNYLKQLKETSSDAKTKPIPFVLVAAALTEQSALRSAGRLKYAKDIGYYDILSKPLDHDRLRACLARVAAEMEPKDEIDNLGILPDLLTETIKTLITEKDGPGAGRLIKLLEAGLVGLKAVH